MLAALEAALVRALAADDPWAALARERDALPPEARALLDRVDREGFVLTSLLVRKLRFERLCRGDAAAAEAAHADPAGFAERFRAYGEAVAPRAFFPSEEAAAYRAWVAAPGDAPAQPGA